MDKKLTKNGTFVYLIKQFYFNDVFLSNGSRKALVQTLKTSIRDLNQ